MVAKVQIFVIFTAVVCVAFIVPLSYGEDTCKSARKCNCTCPPVPGINDGLICHCPNCATPPPPKCNCSCPVSPKANTSCNKNIICHCPECPPPVCNCTCPSNSTTQAPTSTPSNICYCPICPPPTNPPECDCSKACPKVLCACPACIET